jgi:hypothetical protein
LKNQENFKPFKEIFDKMDAYFKTIFTKKIIKINKIEYNKKNYQ